jgi:hypothetical protein
VALRNLASTTTVNIADDDIVNVALDYTADATANIDLGAIQTLGTFTVTDAQIVNIDAIGAADTTIAGATSLDATDVDELNITTSVAGSGITTGAAFGADNVVRVSLSTGATNAHINLAGGTFLTTADLLETLTISASGDDDSDVTTGVLGGAVGGAAAALTSVTLTADDGADIALGNIDAEGATITSITATSLEAASNIDIGNIGDDVANITSISRITLSAVAGSTIDIDNIEAGTVGTISLSGAGTFTLDGADSDITSLETVDASGTSGTVTLVLDDVVNASNITLGTGTNTLTTTGAGDTITLAVEDGTDQINIVAGSGITINNFEAGNADEDLLFTLAGIEALTEDVATLDDHDDLVAATEAVVFYSVAAGAINLANATANSNILVLSTVLTTALDTALEAGGAYAVTTSNAGAGFDAGDGFLVLWSDGTDSYLSLATSTAGGDGVAIAANDLTITNLVTFAGITDADNIVAGQFDAFA